MLAGTVVFAVQSVLPGLSRSSAFRTELGAVLHFTSAVCAKLTHSLIRPFLIASAIFLLTDYSRIVVFFQVWEAQTEFFAGLQYTHIAQENKKIGEIGPYVLKLDEPQPPCA